MAGHFFKTGFLAIFTLALAGCKFAVINVEGGFVDSLSGVRDCRGPNVCITEVTNHSFDDSFEAIPDPGWEFVRWNSGGNFICADSRETVCRVSSVGTEGNPLAELIIGSDAFYYLMPIFQRIPTTPITDIRTVNGVEWAQPDLFLNVSGTEINAACPGGVCSGGLNGWDLNGWFYATPTQLGALFNVYIGSNYFDGNPNVWFSTTNEIAIAAFVEAGWRYTSSEGVAGLVRNPASESDHYIGSSCDECDLIGNTVDSFAIATPADPSASPETGAWFYRLLPP